jgi:phosphatidylserine/phosphatidylglycerophosphate/cardiolipin synthase-like enzyme
MVIDGQTLVTGSCNFTSAAETKKAENLLIISDLSIAAKYSQNWKDHAAHSKIYRGR